VGESASQRLHAVVEGHVQGVGFRYFVMEEAVRLGLRGWVRNIADGSVEVTAEGSEEALRELVDRLRHGPRMASVTWVQEDWSAGSGEYTRFRLRPTE
jgi:acylphosphatase